jgi:predicted glycosyltransferase
MLRREMIRNLVVSFAPDVFLVDNFPLGSGDELLATLHELRRGPTRTVLGLRDIVDSPETVRNDWGRQRMYDVLDRYYDRVLVYGMREVLDAAEAYALPPTISSKIRYCGYVAEDFTEREFEEHPARELGIAKPFLLATAGGGGDGFPLLKALAGALHRIADLPAVIVTGPLMSPADRERLRSAIGKRPETVLLDYLPDLPRYIAAARLVVAMGGYNTAAEIVALGARALVAPRTWRYGEHRKRSEVRAEGEQRLRAEALSRLGLVEVLDPEALTPEAVAACVERSLAAKRPCSAVRLDLAGRERVASELLALVGVEGIAS